MHKHKDRREQFERRACTAQANTKTTGRGCPCRFCVWLRRTGTGIPAEAMPGTANLLALAELYEMPVDALLRGQRPG